MLIVSTPDGDIKHDDAMDWSITPGDERLLIQGPDNTGPEQPSRPKVLAEYARGSWQHVRRAPEDPNAPSS